MLAWPGPGARAKNPYTWLLYSHLSALGVGVREFTPARALRGGYDVLHVHWPEKALGDFPGVRRLAGAAAGLAVLRAAHFHGARVVWTAHNASPHDAGQGPLERWYWSAVMQRVDAVIHPSAAGQRAVEERFPALAERPRRLVPHGHYRGAYPDCVSAEDARAALKVPATARVAAFVGLVRPYKNVPHLIRLVRALEDDPNPPILLVAGAPLNSALAEKVRSAAAGDHRILLALEHVPDERLQYFFRAADLVVLPFQEITTSGSAVLALSFDRPVLVPERGAMAELRTLVGDEWVRTYEGELTRELLRDALEWSSRPRSGRPRLDRLEWQEIARDTLALYHAARPGRQGPRVRGAPARGA